MPPIAGPPALPTCSPVWCSSGADKNIQNDEPLSCSSSSDEEVDESELTREELAERAASQPINTRKRRAGHTPLDLATCHKVTHPQERL